MGMALKSVVAVSLASVVAAGAVMPLEGCAARRRAREAAAAERTYARTSFVNQGDMPVRVTLVVGERTDAPPGLGSTFMDTPRLIPPGGTYQAVVQDRKPYGVGFLFPENEDLVVRFKLEAAAATWEPARVAWFESVGPLPEVIRLMPGEGGAPTAISDVGRLEPVPREWWPKE